MKLIIFVVGGTILIAALLILVLPSLNQNSGGKIVVEPLEYDAGTVSLVGGLVQKTYEIQNQGKDDLKIDDIWTSCACTTASLKIGNKVSPQFGMPGHGTNPAFWSEILKPGEKARLEVTFNPAFHGPQGIGENLRIIYLSTSDPQNKQVQVRLLAKVVP